MATALDFASLQHNGSNGSTSMKHQVPALSQLSEVSEVQEEDSWYDGGDIEEQVAKVYEMLGAIFEYYCIQGSGHTALQEPRMSSARFQRMAIDAGLVDGSGAVTSARVDVVFHRTCGGSPHMHMAQFREAMVRIACMKFPSSPDQEAVVRMYDAYLKSFSDQGDLAIFENLDPGMLAVIAAAQSKLQMIYDNYFKVEAKPRANQRPSVAESDLQHSFTQVFMDFEVSPALVPKSTVYQVFREVARVREIPGDVREQIAAGGGEAAQRCRFTYVHFAAAVALLAHRCFAESTTGATNVMRLLEWMDSSKGRTVFSMNFPGRAHGRGSFRITPDPDKLPGSLLQILDDGAVGTASARASLAVGADPAAAPDGALHGAAPAEADRRASTSSVPGTGAPPQRRSVKQAAPATRASETQRASGDFSWRRSSTGGADAAAAAVAGLPDWARRLAQQTFGHYAALSDPLNRTALSSGKFGRFLRDIGLISSPEAHQGANGHDRRPSTASSTGANYRHSATSPTGFSRRSTTSYPSTRSTSPLNGRDSRSGSVGAVPAFQPRRSSVPIACVAPGTGEMPTRQSGARFSVSRSKTLSQVGGGDAGGNGAGQGLPLQVFPMTSVSQAESDLIFMQALGRNSGTKNMSVDAFLRALADLATRCQASEGADMPVNQALEEFCSRVLAPLTELLPEGSAYDLPAVDRLFNEPETQSTFEHYQAGLDKIFAAYGVEKAGQRAFWTPDSILKFAKDFDIAEEVGHLPLRRLFKDCVHYANCGGSTRNDEEMQLPCYRLALAMLSQRVHSNADPASPPERLAAFLQRISSVATSRSFNSRYGHSGRTAALQPRTG